MYEIIGCSFSLKYVGTVSVTDLLLRIDGKFIASIPLFVKVRLINCVLASVLWRSLRTGLNNLLLAVSKMIAVTRYSADS